MNQHTAELAEFLIALGRAGVELATAPSDSTKVRHRPAVLPPVLAARLMPLKPQVLALLQLGYTPADEDADHAFNERLGAASELGMPTHTGSPAWWIGVGEGLLAQLGGAA